MSSFMPVFPSMVPRPALAKTYATSVPVQVIGSAAHPSSSDKLVTSHTHNRFVPMQLRTQPNNLTASQLQRVNSALSETGLSMLCFYVLCFSICLS